MKNLRRGGAIFCPRSLRWSWNRVSLMGMKTRHGCVPFSPVSRNSSMCVRTKSRPWCDGSPLAMILEILVSQAALMSEAAILTATNRGTDVCAELRRKISEVRQDARAAAVRGELTRRHSLPATR